MRDDECIRDQLRGLIVEACYVTHYAVGIILVLADGRAVYHSAWNQETIDVAAPTGVVRDVTATPIPPYDEAQKREFTVWIGAHGWVRFETGNWKVPFQEIVGDTLWRDAELLA